MTAMGKPAFEIVETEERRLMADAAVLGLTMGEIARLREADRLRQAIKGTRGWRKAHDRADQLVASVKASMGDTARGVLALERRKVLDVMTASIDRQIAEGSADLADRARLIRKAEAKISVCEPFNDAGAVRIKSRDGLVSLRDRGRISVVQLNAGLAYRALYEPMGSDLRSQLADRTGSGSASPDGLIWSRLKVAKVGLSRERIERAVVASTRGTNHWPGVKELKTLRAVAGEGRCLKEFVGGGRQMELYISALSRALDVAALRLGMASAIKAS